MKKTLFFLAIGIILFSCSQNKEPNKKVKDGIFIHIKESYDNPQKVLMPMRMATIMAEDYDVLIYVDINAVELLIQGAQDVRFQEFDSFQTYLKQLLEKGVKVYACPGCLKAADLNPKYLIKGVELAQKDQFFNFTKGRIITLDY